MPRLSFAFAACALLGLAAVASPPAGERARLGPATGRLEWGPALFRWLLVFHGLVLGIAAWRGGVPAPAPDGPGTEGSPARIGRGTWLALLVLAAVALALRLVRLGTDLWVDELLTFTDFARRPLAEIVTSFPNQNQHMLYSILGRLSLLAFGDTPAALRLPAVLFGVGSIVALFVLGRRIAGAREAWMAAALATFSYHHVWFSQNARGYSGLLFFTVLATWLYLEALERRRARWWAAYAASLVAGLSIHMTMLFVAAAHALVHALELAAPSRGRRRPAVLPALAAWVLAGTATAQLYALSLPEFLGSAVHEVSLDSEWTDPFWVFRETAARLADAGVVGAAAALGFAVLAAGWISLARSDRAAALAMVLPGVLGAGAMLALGHNLWPRFFFFCMGFALLALARGIREVPRLLLAPFGAARRFAEGAASAGMALVVVVSALTLPRVYALPKQDFSGARDFVLAEMGPGDVAVAVGLAGAVFGRYFAPDWPVPETAEELEDLRGSHATVWLVYTLPIQLEAWHPDVWGTVQSEFEVARVFRGTLGNGDVVVVKSRPPQGASGS
ncbi:MAG: glycosyltransferase family 39 protein [Candidatus Eiseniibacteriota bacterium]